MKKQVLIDAMDLTYERPKGAQVHIFNFLSQLSAIKSDFEFTVLIAKTEKGPWLPEASHIRYNKINTQHVILWRLLELLKYIKKGRFDLLHLINESSILGNIDIPYVMTVHESLKKYYMYSEKIDIFDFKKKMVKTIYLALRKKMVERANMLIAISNSTKKDLISEYGLPEDRIKVIYWAANKAFFYKWEEKSLENKNYRSPYILIFATGDKRENVFCELKAFARIKNKINHNLFIVGIPAGGFERELMKICNRLDISERIKLFNYINNDELITIYKNAALYVDMSLLEGFGLQVLEAMAAGVPVITSDVDSLPEVVGDAGILLDPNDDRALSDAMLEVLNNDEKRKERSQASYKRAKRFSWEKTAEETLKCYKEVLCPPSR